MKYEVKNVHELSIMEGVLKMVRDSASQSNIRKVYKINLVIGKLTMVLPDSMQFCFQALSSQDQLLQGAVLEIEERDIIIQCARCKQESILNDGFTFICPGCGASEVEIINGRELYLDYYEGDEC